MPVSPRQETRTTNSQSELFVDSSSDNESESTDSVTCDAVREVDL